MAVAQGEVSKQSLPDMNAAAAAWEEESAGISEPLYGVLDELFRMQGRGFIRPLVGFESAVKLAIIGLDVAHHHLFRLHYTNAFPSTTSVSAL